MLQDWQMSTIDGRHCRIDGYRDQLTIEDLRSQYGTRVEATPAQPGKTYLLESGMKFWLGEHLFRIRIYHREIQAYQEKNQGAATTATTLSMSNRDTIPD